MAVEKKYTLYVDGEVQGEWTDWKVAIDAFNLYKNEEQPFTNEVKLIETRQRGLITHGVKVVSAPRKAAKRKEKD